MHKVQDRGTLSVNVIINENKIEITEDWENKYTLKDQDNNILKIEKINNDYFVLNRLNDSSEYSKELVKNKEMIKVLENYNHRQDIERKLTPEEYEEEDFEYYDEFEEE